MHTYQPESARAWPHSILVRKSGSRGKENPGRVRSLQAKFKRMTRDINADKFIKGNRDRERKKKLKVKRKDKCIHRQTNTPI